MACVQVAEAVKSAYTRITTSSTRVQVEVLQHVLLPSIRDTKQDISDGVVRAVIRVLSFTLGRYKYRKPRQAIEEVISVLLERNANVTIQALLSVFDEFIEPLQKSVPSRSSSVTALVALNWSCIVARHLSKTSDDEEIWRRLIKCQMVLLSAAMASRQQSIQHSAKQKLKVLWQENKEMCWRYSRMLEKDTPSQHFISMASHLFTVALSAGDADLVNVCKAIAIDGYVKAVLVAKTQPRDYILACFGAVLKLVDHETFNGSLLPAIQKALLRNPEDVMTAVIQLVKDISIDLSRYSVDIAKPVSAQLVSKKEWMRESAVEFLRSLASQCSDREAVDKLIKLLADILNGSEGKLTLWEQRVGVLTGLSSLSHHQVTGSSASDMLSLSVIESIIPFLEREGHDGTLACGLSTLGLWTVKFSTSLPDSLLTFFKKCFGKSTISAKTALLRCMLVTFKGNCLVQGIDFLPQLQASVDKAVSRMHQIAVVTEGLTAAALLVQLSTADATVEPRLSDFWNTLLHSDKQIFTSSKFLGAASTEGLMTLLELTERLMTDHAQKLGQQQIRQWSYPLVIMALHSSYNMRREAQLTIKKLLMYADSDILRQNLYFSYEEVLLSRDNTRKIENETFDGSEETDSTASGKQQAGKNLVQLLLVLVSVSSTAEIVEKETIALDVFLLAHHPSVVCIDKHVWLKVLKKLGISVTELVQQHGAILWQRLEDKLQTVKESCSAFNCLTTLCELAPSYSIPVVTDRVMRGLKDDRLMQVTQTEVDIMNTPEGQLYNKSIIASAKASASASEQNIKRESKAYSYEEQQWDRQLREELQQKKEQEQKSSRTHKKKTVAAEKGSSKNSSAGTVGVSDDKLQLTKKQQEAIEASKAEEQGIRRRLRNLSDEFETTVELLSVAIEANPVALNPHVPSFVSRILSLMKSPLASAGACRLWLKLQFVVFPNSLAGLGTLVAHASLRLLEPLSALDHLWSEEPCSSQAARAVELLLSVLSVQSHQFHAGHFPTAMFVYCCPLLKRVLQADGVCVQGNVTARQQALELILAHSKSRKSSDNDIEWNPDLMPRDQLMSILAHVITSSGDLRKTSQLKNIAMSAFSELCVSGSGKDGCGRGTLVDIQVLLDCLMSPVEDLRYIAVKGLLSMIKVLPSVEDRNESNEVAKFLVQRVYVAQFDAADRVKARAKELWNDAGLVVPESLLLTLIEDVLHFEPVVHVSASKATAAALQEWSDMVGAVIETLFAAYKEKLKVPPIVKDDIGRVLSLPFIDPWASRCGIALALGKIAPHLSDREIDSVFSFFVHYGLSDRVEKVRSLMLDAGLSALNIHGKDHVHNLLPLFEEFLETAPNSSEVDPVRQSVVILIGCLARHLDKDDPKVTLIIDQLVKALDTPSQQVQEAVASCLPPLIRFVQDSATDLVAQLMEKLLQGSRFAERKGAAYGLAGVVKGLGVSILTQFGIGDKLQEAVANKKSYKHREGALFAYEILSSMLGRLYEPHVIHFIPNLLVCFGDGNQYVREAADDTARAIMAQLSGHGVKRILPSLLSALDDDSWRTKTGSVELLGKMAYCAPQQLSACLPSIVPRLMEVLADSHAKVQNSGVEALKQIGSVIKNQEIQTLVPELLETMSNIAGKSQNCLQLLLQTQFVHTIDAASLALIMPIVERSLDLRSTETKRLACQLLAEMYTFTDPKDLEPYIPSIMPGLKTALVDPVPEVRAVTAQALGSMVTAMGGDSFEDLVPWLLKTIQSDQSNVDRSGGAQGLCHVLLARGSEKLEEMMPSFIDASQCSDHPAHVRDGYLTLFVYLPVSFGNDFITYIADIIPPILKGLSDESEFVRDTALSAGQCIVTRYAETAVEVFLPELEKGLSDENWRIRYSSIQLLGDLLYHISGVTGKMTTVSDEDDNFGTEHSTRALIQTLGIERRNRVLSGLYMSRSDEAVMVRQTALHVWKIVVANTARTLKEILPVLLSMLLKSLASVSDDRQQVAARTLGDIVRKLGERILPEIIPILEHGLLSESSVERQGVCVGLSEIMASTSKDYLQAFQDSLIPTVRRALYDPLPEVRAAAAMTFDNLHSNIGPKALEDILPSLLNILKSGGDEVEFALDGLKQVMIVKSRIVMPFLVPKLIAQPVNMKALALLSSVAGDALTRHLGTILPALLKALSTSVDNTDNDEEMESSRLLILSVTGEAGVRCVIDELMSAGKNSHAGVRKASVVLLHVFCSETRADYKQYVPKLIIGLIQMFGDPEHSVVTSAWDALNAVTGRLLPIDQLSCIAHIRQGIKFVKADFEGQDLPGFCLDKKGIKPLLQVFREGVLNGSPECKEKAAAGLGDVIALTSAEALKPHVITITGPLIRILGDRFSWNVKVAILDTLGLVIVKGGVAAKAFVPQLQTTFVKALNDANRTVRLRAASALEKLVVLQIRVDPLFNDLSSGIKNNEEPGIKQTFLVALQGTLRGGGARMSESVRHNVTSLVSSLLQVSDDMIQQAAASCIGALCLVLPDEELNQLVDENFLCDHSSDEWRLRCGRSLAMHEALVSALHRVVIANNREKWLITVVSHVSSDRVSLCVAGLNCVGQLMSESVDAKSILLPCIVKSLINSSNEVRVAAASTVKKVAEASKFSTEDLQQLVPPLLEGTQEKNSPVRLSAEQALVSALELRKSDATFQECLTVLDSEKASSLAASYKKTLSRLASQKDDTDTTATELY